MLVGVVFPGTDPEAVEANLDELALLVDTAGADVAARVVQRRDRPDPATFVGRGKVAELAALSVRGRRRHRGLRRRAVAGPAAEPGEAAGAHGHRPHGGDPRHLRPERPQPSRARPRSSWPSCATACPACAGRGLSLSQQAGHIGTRGPGETQLEVDRRRLVRRMHRLEDDLRDVERTRARPAPVPGAGPPPRAGPGGLHQRRQVDPPQPPDRRRGAGREPPLRHLGPANPPVRPARRGDGAGDRHRRVRPQAPPRAGRGVRLHPRVGRGWRTWWSTWSTARPPTPRARWTPCAAVLERDRGGRRPRAGGGEQGRRLARGGPPGQGDRGCGLRLGPHRRGHRRPAARRGRPAAGGRPGGGAGHPLGPGRRAGRRPPRGRGGRPERRATRRRGSTSCSTRPAGPASQSSWRPRRDHGGRARRLPAAPLPLRPPGRAEGAGRGAPRRGGRLLGGHALRRAPAAVVRALAVSGTERGYPASAGGPALRRAAADWLRRRFEVAIDPSLVAACVGTKEMVASTAAVPARCATRRATRCSTRPSPTPPTPWGRPWPAAGPWPSPRPTPDGSGLDLGAVSPAEAGRALLLWVNSPANPTGGLTDLAAAAEWGRRREVPVFSDECYTEFTWDGPPRSVLQSGTEGVVAVHSLSKRSNLAGVRAGFYAGDPELVGYLRVGAPARRPHGARPGPGGRGGGPGRRRARGRPAGALPRAAARSWPASSPRRGARSTCRPAASTCGSRSPPAGPTAGRSPPTWPEAAGLLVSPGDLYGEAGRGHVRVAVVQPMERLALVAERLTGSGWR